MACFEHDDLIEKIVGLAENFELAALIRVGGIRKTSVALAVLHHDCVRDRLMTTVDSSVATSFHLHAAPFSRPPLKSHRCEGLRPPEDMRALRALLFSREMFIILDNVESILDLRRASAQEIYALVNKVSQFKLISICVTS